MVLERLGVLVVGAALLTVPGCRHGDCVTACGETVYSSDETRPVDQAACAALNREELSAVIHLPFKDVCEKLSRVSVMVNRAAGPNGDWVAPQGDGGVMTVLGLSRCNGHEIEVGTEVWNNSAIVHEQVHQLQCPFEDYTHATWADAGIWGAIAATYPDF